MKTYVSAHFLFEIYYYRHHHFELDSSDTLNILRLEFLQKKLILDVNFFLRTNFRGIFKAFYGIKFLKTFSATEKSVNRHKPKRNWGCTIKLHLAVQWRGKRASKRLHAIAIPFSSTMQFHISSHMYAPFHAQSLGFICSNLYEQ